MQQPDPGTTNTPNFKKTIILCIGGKTTNEKPWLSQNTQDLETKTICFSNLIQDSYW